MTHRTLAVGLVLALGSTDAFAQCVPVPALLDKWNQEIEAGIATAAAGKPSPQDIRDRIQSLRTQVEGLPNPFYKVARMDSVERRALRNPERVLWEDGELMVLVNVPRSTDLYALVIPKERGIWFPVDANPRLMRRLEETAAIVSDSFMHAAGRACSPGNTPTIEIHTPQALGIQQLHIHVHGVTPQAGADHEALYTKASAYLSEKLWPTARY